jgi:hypothetical protein
MTGLSALIEAARRDSHPAAIGVDARKATTLAVVEPTLRVFGERLLIARGTRAGPNGLALAAESARPAPFQRRVIVPVFEVQMDGTQIEKAAQLREHGPRLFAEVRVVTRGRS